MNKLKLFNSQKTDLKYYSVFILIFSITILFFLNTKTTFSQEVCNNDDDCDKFQAANDCCGEDSCEIYAVSSLLVSTMNAIQKRDLNGGFTGSFLPLTGVEYTFLSPTPEGNVIISEYLSGNVSSFDILNNIPLSRNSRYRSPKSTVFDIYWNMYVLNSGSSEILKTDAEGNITYKYPLMRPANTITILPDQCTMLISYDDGSIYKTDLCSGMQKSEPFSTGYLKHAYTLSALENGEVLASDGDNIIRLDKNGKPVMTYDIPAHDHWFALTVIQTEGTFWCADYCSSNVWKFDIESGKPLMHFNTGTPSGTVYGLLAVQTAPPEPEENLLYAELNLKVALENRSKYEERISVILRNASPPYEKINTQECMVDAEGYCSSITYTDLIKGKKYYIVTNTANSIERWSSEPVSFDITPVEYEFSSSPDEIASYGDLNQDGVIDIEDLAIIENEITFTEKNKSDDGMEITENFKNNEYEIIDKNVEKIIVSDKISKVAFNNLSIFDLRKSPFLKIDGLAEPCVNIDTKNTKVTEKVRVTVPVKSESEIKNKKINEE